MYIYIFIGKPSLMPSLCIRGLISLASISYCIRLDTRGYTACKHSSRLFHCNLLEHNLLTNDNTPTRRPVQPLY